MTLCPNLSIQSHPIDEVPKLSSTPPSNTAAPNPSQLIRMGAVALVPCSLPPSSIYPSKGEGSMWGTEWARDKAHLHPPLQDASPAAAARTSAPPRQVGINPKTPTPNRWPCCTNPAFCPPRLSTCSFPVIMSQRLQWRQLRFSSMSVRVLFSPPPP
eukprot:CAMPEP_0183327268 /NCGR_PEP_ID=MMETSP0160_2-20130417/83678_1 /TAXON_ID=2839 ORGANISM="Odontella Sinensis, Strain Grunow 1884" /NCGR_SAMPLE_ID=MMETSP0160_2 /ASSEMBLY_ACC=CAM_ASM_000250 /LENGTH=156 /DNA_ID=CAMNT_0025495393 /DNA_START=120 /DNA_END=590 /DNA_ORIENTATION=+